MDLEETCVANRRGRAGVVSPRDARGGASHERRTSTRGAPVIPGLVLSALGPPGKLREPLGEILVLVSRGVPFSGGLVWVGNIVVIVVRTTKITIW